MKPLLLGLDFDNTLISYDQLFYRVALDKALIPEETLQQKNAVRDYLRQQDQEEDWTRLQGEVYGSRILEAIPYQGMLDVINSFSSKQIPMRIVSHKTRTPYLGEPWDLHAAARSWLAQQKIHGSNEMALSAGQVFFELTKEAKVERILELGCTHYVDDLPEILQMIPDHVEKILFSPDAKSDKYPDWNLMRSWQELPAILQVQ